MPRNMGRLISSKATDQGGENKRGSMKNGNSVDSNSDSQVDSNSNIADVVQGFVQAQANITNNTMASNEIINLLQQVNSRLEQLPQFQASLGQNQQLAGNNQQASNQQASNQQASNQQSGQQDNSNQQANNMVSQELQNLFSQILQPNNAQPQSSNQENTKKNESANQNPAKAMAVQTAGQVLAQAQYELANELEASLQKLKQVISDSEKIANQISNLLGESSNKKS